MAEIHFSTTAPTETILDVAYREAHNLGFDVAQTDDLRLDARRGNIALSVLLGAFVGYCDFRLEIREFDADNELSLCRAVLEFHGEDRTVHTGDGLADLAIGHGAVGGARPSWPMSIAIAAHARGKNAQLHSLLCAVGLWNAAAGDIVTRLDVGG